MSDYPTRHEKDPPLAIADWGWRYHHTGIPTTKKMPNERYLSQLKCYVSGFEKSPFGIEWMRFDKDSRVHDLVKALPHLAFEVNDLEAELEKHQFNILTPPTAPAIGIRIAMIEYNGTPIELMEIDR